MALQVNIENERSSGWRVPMGEMGGSAATTDDSLVAWANHAQDSGQAIAAMSDTSQSASPPLLTENEKALLRRCYHIKKITDDEIVFPLTAPSIAKAAWFTMFWFLLALMPVSVRWVDHKLGPSISWLLLGVFPTFFLIWLADQGRRFLVLKRATRTMLIDLGDGRWTIDLPHGCSPADWDFPTASVPVRMTSDEVERVEAWAILQRFSGSSLSEKGESSYLPILEKCGADLVGYDEESISIANFGSARQWVACAGAAMLAAPTIAMCCYLLLPTNTPAIAVVTGILSTLGPCWIVYDGRRASVATFLKGKREVFFRHRGTVRTYDVHEGAVRVVGDGDAGELVVVPGVFSSSPPCGTANLLAGFLRKYLAPPKGKDPTPGS